MGELSSGAQWCFLGSRSVESSGVVSPAEGSCNGVVGGAVQRSQWSCRGEPSSGAQWTTLAQCSPVSCPGKPFSGGVVGVQQARGVAGEPCSGVVGGSRPAEAQWSCRSTSGVVGPAVQRRPSGVVGPVFSGGAVGLSGRPSCGGLVKFALFLTF